MKRFKHITIALAAALIIYSCKPADGNHPGSEYMPDMGHSVAYEANVYNYYFLNTWDSASVFPLYHLAQPGLPVAGTVPRGYAGVHFAQSASDREDVMENLNGKTDINAISVPVNPHVPYYYEDTPEERERATNELIENPYPITAEGLAKGKELYNIFCGICHGENGGGMGYLVSDENPNAKYPAVPANFLADQFLEASNGRYYHSIMYGLNVMGAYKDKINYEERWQVIHYIRSLQAKELGVKYNAEVNELNPEFGTPQAQISVMAGAVSDETQATGSATEGEQEEESGSHGGQ